MRQLIIVANRLPFSIQEQAQGLILKPSPGGMAAALGPVRDRYRAQWVGWHGLNRPLTAAEYRKLVVPRYAHPVDIPAAAYHNYYYAVTNGSLWPVLHGFKPQRLYTDAAWESNRLVNQQFAKVITTKAGPGDVIWIHDFHLFLLPAFLRQAGMTNRISFFLHVPFANPELFGQLPHWQDMLASLQHVNFCGVQTTGDKINMQTLYNKLGKAPPIHNVPIGIDYAAFTQPATKESADYYKTLERQMVGKTVALSASRLDYTKGILQQLQAVEQLHERAYRPDFVYKLIVAPSRELLQEYSELKDAIESLVTRINRRFPGAVQYSYRNFGLDELTAWYRRADIMMVTPFIDGMNLVAKEYLAVRKKPGVLILSNAAGAAQQLTRALLVDPRSVDQICTALQKAFTMPSSERAKRFAQLRQNVREYDVFRWAQECLGH